MGPPRRKAGTGMEETREALLSRLHSERYGPMRRSFEWGRTQLLADIFALAGRCSVEPDEMNHMSILRYGIEFRDLDDEQLRAERQRLAILHTKLDHPANGEDFYSFNSIRPVA